MARSWVRRTSLALAVVAGAFTLAMAGLYLYTERLLEVDQASTHAAWPPLPPGDAAEGARLGQVLGCTACHGADLGGAVFVHIPRTARVVAGNLTRARGRYDDDALLRLLRTGAKADGRLALVMPTKAFQRLRDQQVADVAAWLRSVPAVERELPATWLGPLARLGVVLGAYDIESMRADAPESPAVLADRNGADRGRHLAQVVCGECHGVDLAGYPEDGTPGLQVVKAYSADAFGRLLREGTIKAGGDSASGLMSSVARYRFGALHEDEIADLKRYLDQH
jgi:mono/diheme cytochrome c family protein